MLGILDPTVALDFDNCAAMRLLEWEDDRAAAMWGVDPDQEIRVERYH